MYITDILQQDAYCIHSGQSIQEALDKMNGEERRSIPFLSEGKYQGLLFKKELDSIRNKRILAVDSDAVFIYGYATQHPYEYFGQMSRFKIELLPICDFSQKYLGYVTLSDVTATLNKILSIDQEGSIILIELASNDVSFSHIAHIIEMENGKIINMTAQHISETDKVDLHIKVAQKRIDTIISSLIRNNYFVKATFSNDQEHSNIESRYKQLMHYIDL
ncbi:MAG TPA: CBS domain-containing protein [Sphingobacterium sp.]|nr:CBS domain-containing protein [Sphingobacterium sp.]